MVFIDTIYSEFFLVKKQLFHWPMNWQRQMATRIIPTMLFLLFLIKRCLPRDKHIVVQKVFILHKKKNLFTLFAKEIEDNGRIELPAGAAAIYSELAPVSSNGLLSFF